MLPFTNARLRSESNPQSYNMACTYKKPFFPSEKIFFALHRSCVYVMPNSLARSHANKPSPIEVSSCMASQQQMMMMRNKKRPAIISCVILIWADMNADLFDKQKKKKRRQHYITKTYVMVQEIEKVKGGLQSKTHFLEYLHDATDG